MEIPLLDLTTQYESISGELDEAVRTIVHSQRFILGEPVERLETSLAEMIGAGYTVGCASGTDALLLPLRAFWRQSEDEVVIPAFTFFATAGAVWNAGYRPVFCDVDPLTFNVTAETVAAAWTDRTRGVIPVHLFGQMAPMEEIGAVARERGGFVLEDAAQAIGAAQCLSAGAMGGTAGTVEGAATEADRAAETDVGTDQSAVGGVKAGAAGDAGAFSFFPTKNLGGFGDGGLVSTNDAELAGKLKKLRVHGGLKMYHHEMVGTNSRLDALQAAVLSAKLPHLKSWSDARRRNAALYDELLADVAEVITPAVAPGNVHVYNQYTIRARRRDELRDYLNDKGIGSAVYYPLALHLQACFSELGYREGDLPVSEKLCAEVLSLPVFPELGELRVAAVAEAIREFYA